MKTGYWNGEPTAQFEGITYEVTKIESKPLHWQNPLAGTRRQGLIITQGNETWIIDNEHGDGYHKLTEGHGMWTSGHASVTNPINIERIQDNEINILLNPDLLLKERRESDFYFEKNFPEEFNRMKELRAGLKEMRKNMPK